MKSWKTPTPDQVDRAVALLGHTGHYRYFFDRLKNPEWIKPLQAKGFFCHPPPPDRDEEKETIGFPPWPESLYLARIAHVKPELVLDVILTIPETENVRVYEDLADAALAMPPNLTAKLSEKAKQWAQSRYYQFVLPKKLGNLVAHLARGGEVDDALDLARILLEVLPDPKSDEKAKEDTYSLPPSPAVRFDQWHYEEILKKNIPELVKAGGAKAFDLLCDLLQTAVHYSQRNAEKGATEDYSWIWRPAIEDHPQNHHGLKDSLVTAVRDAGESLIRTERADVGHLVERLESRPWLAFHRIALHLLRCFSETSPDLIAQYLTDRALFDAPHSRHEYSLLLRGSFSLLSDPQQQVILGWIAEGPDLERFKQRQQKFAGKRPTDEDAERYRKYWQRDRLAWFKNSLPEVWRQLYEELVAEFGQPEHPEFASYSTGGWVGPTSPKSADELQAMTVSEICGFLKTWQPSGEPMTPSPEGLGRVLSTVVGERPNSFSEEAHEFQGLSPTYVCALLSGFRDALGKGQTFDWKPVLDLCGWVLGQPLEIEGEGHEEIDEDPHWEWTRKTVAELLSAGFKEGTGSIHFKYRETVWRILQPLTEDPDPTPEYEAEYGGSNMDPTTISINTTRGEAMHAVIRYALWVRRHLEKEPDGKERLDRGFDEMMEVREVLKARLDPLVEPSLAIRAVYGQWFPWLVLLDPTWAKQNANQIFPAEGDKRSFWEAAWNAYVTHCQAYDNVFEALEDQYALAIDRLSESGDEVDSYRDPQVRFGEHLMVFYWRGKLDLDEPEGLLGRFWKKASPAVRGRALEFVGRSLKDTKGDVPPGILKRLRLLWEKRRSEAGIAQDVELFLSEMKAFGWWFASAKFDDEWAIKQMLEALKLAQKTDPHHLVVERLAGVAEKMPLEAVQCLERLAKGDREGWEIHGWLKDAQTILRHALESKGEAAGLAEDLIHYLGSRGYLEFRTLLQNV